MGEIAAYAEDLSKRYSKDGPFAFEGVTFQVPENTIVSLIGHNGSGKSSLLEVVSGTRRPTSGTVRVFGEDPMGIRGKIGYLPQRFDLFHELTVRENIRYFSTMYGSDIDIERTMARYGVLDYSDKRYTSLSGGMRRHSEIACILVGDPDFIIMDEPSAGLDPESCRGLWELIDELKESGKTLLIASHEVPEAKRNSDTVILMENGHQTYCGRPEGVE